MSNTRFFLAAIAATGLAGCGSGAAPSSEQVVTGQTESDSFPGSVDEVRAVHGSEVVAQGEVAGDGTFEVTIPAGRGYELIFTGERAVALVFPRLDGGIEVRFDIRAGGDPFDLGMIRYIGDPLGTTFAFDQVGTTSQLLTASGGAPEADAVECEDGIDAITGAVCVDDEDDEGAGACEGEAESEADGDEVDCVDGIDSVTGAECDGGPEANAADAAEGEVPSEAAVADHNLPASMGCAEDEGEHECEDGIDPATGLECDGGPAANP